jgi:hypothetical protein
MCRFKSAICLKDRVFVPDYDSHNKMLEELHIKDDFAHAGKVFVRVELVPEDGDKTTDVDEWKLNVDQDVLPDWWDKNDYLPRIKAAVKAWCDIHILRNGAHIVRDGIWYVYGSANVTAYGSARVTAYDSANVTACDSASVTAYGSANVTAYDNACVTAFDNASVKAHNSANVTAYDSASVKAHNSANVTACDRASVTACDRANVMACSSASVAACDSASVTACDSASVTAYDSASVRAYDSASVTVYDNAFVILPKHFQTLNPVLLYDEAICINHKDHTIQSPVKWEQK